MVSEPLAVGIVGCGGISAAHGDAAAGNDDRLSIVACCDVDPDRAAEFAASYDVPATYEDYRTMLDAEALDLVILATWPVQHEEQVLDCVAAGVPGVLCEKSLALDAETAAGMARAADDAGTLLAEGCMYRHLRLQELLAADAVGELRKIRAGFHSVVDDETNWRRDPDRGGGVVYDYTCYCVNAMTMVTGDVPDRVTGTWERREDGLVEELYGTLQYPDETVGIVESSQTAGYRQPLEVQGTEGTLELEHAWSTDHYDDVVEYRGGWESDFAPRVHRAERADPYEAQLLHLCGCLAGDVTCRMPAAESVRNVAIMDAVLEAARTGRAVTPDVPSRP
jgi:predicted dehydrogenase